MTKQLGTVLSVAFTATALLWVASDAALAAPTEKVRVDLHVMSKCPFQAKVMQAFIPVLQELEAHVEVGIEYIGRDEDGELTSMHGWQEVRGDKIQLCAREQGPRRSWLRFIQCQTADEQWREIPNGWEECASAAALPIDAIRGCVDGARGEELLRGSFAKSSAAKATGSPTIFIDGEPYRGGRSSLSLGRAICGRLGGDKPAYCATLPVAEPFEVIVIADERCTERGCDPARFVSFIHHTFEGARVRELDYSDPVARNLFERSDQQYLPIAVFAPGVVKDEGGYDRIKRRLVRLKGGEQLIYPLGRSWDPTAEICDDGQDNTGDGKVDCDDPTCAERVVCRPEIPRKLDLFVMSQCPYGSRVLQQLTAVLDHFGRDRERFDLELNYIGRDEDGKLSSMHGQPEVDEDLRQVCAQQYYGKDYRFMEYVTCRAKDYKKANWRACLPKGMKARVIQKCAKGEEGQRLLRDSFAKTEAIGITGSPNWLLGNRHEMQGREAEAIIAAFCAKNPDVEGCRD